MSFAALEQAAIGIDVGGTRVKSVTLWRGEVRQPREEPVARASHVTFVDQLAHSIIARLGDIESLVAASDPKSVPVGVALPGFFDRPAGRILHLSKFPFLDGFPLRRELQKRLRPTGDVSITLEADTCAGALAEAVLGVASSVDRSLYVSIGTGLGAALIARGEIVRASNNTVGHIAHLPLGNPAEPAEELVSLRGLERLAHEQDLDEDARKVVLSGELETLASGIARERVQAVWNTFGERLGALVGTLANLWHTEMIVLGGGLAQLGDRYWETFQRSSSRHVASVPPRRIKIRRAALGPHAGAIGAALRALGLGEASRAPR